MEHSDHEDDHEDDIDGGLGLNARGSSAYERLARLADRALFDDATAAALFGGEFRGFGGMMSGLSNRFKRLKANLRSPKGAVRLQALRECSDLLLVSNEDTLGAAFSVNSFATEFIAILNGRPNIDPTAETDSSKMDMDAAMDEDAQLAAALAMSTGGFMPGGEQEEMEAQLLACRCLAHLMEALPGSGHTLVHLGAVKALCSKLNEISYIELAEQTLSTMEKISAEYPGAIVREGGLGALLNFLPFFSTNVQRTAVTAAANCCRNVSGDYFAMVREVFPILREVLTQSDQRLVEQATLAVVRSLESYRHSAENLEGLLDLETVVAINALLTPSGGSPIISDTTYTHLLKALSAAARASAKVTIAFLEAGMTSTVHYILTGVLPSSHEETEQGDAPGGQSLGGGVADMVIMQNLAHRPKDQVEEALGLVCELLPPMPRDGVFDSRAYTEKSLAKIKRRGGRPERERPRRQASNRAGDASASSSGPSTPSADVVASAQDSPLSTLAAFNLKTKRDAEAQYEERLRLMKSQPDLVSKFMRALVPVLVDVYAASVSSRVRTKALTGILKATAFAEPDDLQPALTSVPMSSFLGSIISAKDNAAFVLNALQLVEVLVNKLPAVYLTSFLREGVVYEIESLAKEQTGSEKAAEAKAEETLSDTKDDTTTPVKSSEPSTPRACPPGQSATRTGDNPGAISGLLGEVLSSPLPRKSSGIDPYDANIIRARIIIAKSLFAVAGDKHDEAALVLDELRKLVDRLCVPEATEGEIRDTLREIASQFTNVGQSLSSFELLKSGLVAGLLRYVDIDGSVPSNERRAMLYDTFSDSAFTPSPLATLVKRLHESLGRLESFEVETAFNGMGGSSNSLGRTMRIRLQAEEGEDIPKAMSSLSVTIQAIAPVRALHDYLRPRINDPLTLGGGSTLQSMFAAYAASRGGAVGSSTERLLAALAAGPPGQSGLPGSRPLLGGEATPAQESSTKAAVPEPTESKEGAGAKQPRRRSARLSGRPAETESTGEGPSTSAPPTSAPQASTNASPPGFLPHMPMDLDFEDFSEDDYDAEVFEEEMEEELAARRPSEKVVNMSVAPDGSRVEAKTPDGTRIATPNQAAAESAGAGSSGTPTRTGSYAGAVKTAPVDWHLEFSVDGQTLRPTDTIYGAVHKYAKSSPVPGNVFALPVTFKFRKVDGPLPKDEEPQSTLDAPSPATTTSLMPDVVESDQQVSQILRLLRVVHNLCTDRRDSMAGRAAALDESLFVNNKLTAKLTRQLEETMIIASGCLPEWAEELPKFFAFLFPFEVRYAFLRSTSFGYGRLIAHWQASQPRNSSSSRRDEGLPLVSRLSRQKVRISRAQLLESCVKVLELYGKADGILEVEYFDEIGTGLGPTLEFYALASKEFARRSLKLWRDEDESHEGSHVWHPHGLFPAPLKKDEAGRDSQRLSYFKTLGVFVGRAMLDSRIIDLNFNRVFLKMVLNKPVKKSIATLKLVDAPLARSLERLQSYQQARQEIEGLAALPPSTRRSKLAALTIGGAKLHDLSLDFTLPGYDIELKSGGRSIDVDDSNLGEYIELVLDLTLGSGVHHQLQAFQEGFSSIFPVVDLQIFSPDELALLCGNAEEDWSQETLEQAIKADHGYNSDSRVVRDLIDVMTSYSKEERRAFLQFMTGAPKLPLGGFKGLNPQFTVVRKPHEAPFKADDYLPSVMTCATYLKLPNYSSRAVLSSQLMRSMKDGQGSFNLS
ncbi:hypothetical protein CC85DRAFT_298164 [Cutaneotrichosporon oleaginosum]|uniref:HECT-type E3 ubiquitin transferase n=1 Tax=Cutaneotrichosporon oleaginosum TaxID=879819 RepID=A0A0J0XDC1_9TREE|nr:uncharacterized protein CC85DRAFT_298164 [Cutaneotrichosporon oleaginosum]KLT39033.1 hypothetical protein CC85DRAFT_298164 [Cutaneotrichosporon oleaginosum]TXT03956.1 hypothetical protein COLE_07653 [Cutaneotrichosporon oleaginosum]